MSFSDAIVTFNSKKIPVDVKRSDLFKKIQTVDCFLKRRKVTLISLRLGASVGTVDYIDDDDNVHGHRVPGTLYVAFKDFKDKKREATVYAVSDDMIFWEIVGTATINSNPLA